MYASYIPGKRRELFNWRTRQYRWVWTYDLGAKPVIVNRTTGEEQLQPEPFPPLVRRTTPAKPTAADKMICALEAAGEPLTLREISEAASVPETTVQTMLSAFDCFVVAGSRKQRKKPGKRKGQPLKLYDLAERMSSD